MKNKVEKMNPSTSRKPRVAIGMSGGVDSSVAAKILKDQGYEVVGFMMKLWPGSEIKCDRDNACCDIDGLQDAKRIAAILDIPFYVVDVREKFKKEVADYFIEEYKSLRTPNPCVRCNERIKFGWLLDFAKQTGCNYLATGHYARVENDGKFHLLKGKDEKKDQSYFLYRLNQDQLKYIIFPVGKFIKEETRALAKKWNLPVHEKKESQEICFIQEKDYRDFLKKNISEDYFKEGNVVDLKGKIVGKHSGLINYTIGQRKGIEQDKSGKVDDAKPMYAVGFNVEKNQLIVGEDKDIYKDEMIVSDLSWIDSENKKLAMAGKQLSVKIRYRHPAVDCTIRSSDNDQMTVKFSQPQRAITPGQSAVFYMGDEVLGGGIIQ